MDTSCFALQLPGSKPFLVLLSGLLPERRTRRGRSSTLFTSSPKARALARASDLALQACTRAVLAFLIKMGRGKAWRSWSSAEQIAELLPRSAEMPQYSKHHVRRAIRQLVAAGLVRCIRVQPGECFPDKDSPDLDGSGYETQRGGNVVEINIDALLGRGPVWLPPPPAPPSQPSAEDDDAEGPAEAFPGLPAVPSPSPKRDGVSSEREIIHDAGRVITDDDPSDPSPPVSNFDPTPPIGVAAPAAPALNTEDGPSHNSGPCNEASETPRAPTAAPALHPVASQAPRAPERPANESERRERGREHEKCQAPASLRPVGRVVELDAYRRTPPAPPVKPAPPVTVEDMQRDLERLFGPKKHAPPTERGGGEGKPT
jgi:hypothetical protein